MGYFQKRNVHCSTTIEGWHRFFSEMDADDSGRATLEEMEDAFRRCLSQARVSRYELLMLWRRLDLDGSGEVSLDEFVLMMYRNELAMWPRSSDAELARVVKVVSAAISRRHHVEGNWYKVFLFIDPKGTGTIVFEDLQKFLRGTYPGLHLDREELPNDDMFRLWKALDTTEGMRVPKSEFMSFMRRYGGASGKSEKVSKAAVRRNQPDRQTKEQLTSDDTLRRVHTDSDHKNDGEEAEQLPERESLQSRQKPGSPQLRPGTESTHPPSTAASALISTPRRTPGLTGVTAPPGDVRGIDTPTGEQSEAFDVSLSLQRLGAQSAMMRQSHGTFTPQRTFTPEQDPALKLVAERLAEALMAYLHKRGVHCSTTIAGWYRFFSDMDADDSGRATFEEMEDAFQRCLSPGISVAQT
ncbi:unnamed protein product [Cladocopium goreaui]|uniref:EF-hand domain-containing protein n=1 Tax=Cladocopium goreaui TaxID=2562237 RepID=A0A9P1BQL2_9DINO|nr:unnamed protein product [Cladocopium goreaui]